MNIREAFEQVTLLSKVDITSLNDLDLNKFYLNCIEVNSIFNEYYDVKGYIVENPCIEILQDAMGEMAIRFVEKEGYKLIKSTDEIAPGTFIKYPEEWKEYSCLEDGTFVDVSANGEEKESTIWKGNIQLVKIPEIPEYYKEKLSPIIPRRYSVLISDCICCEEYFYEAPRFVGCNRAFIVFE